ncbi:SusC/RagA family TonB-linked outer membrane protein [Xanthocytophaga flava]|uniref:SusC/RagA family TonB-linked outer membrane protein n=1 Tax=Xanthocytophaga flava TaxID=3048013 RepID=UPI0028D2E4DB|nr:TonB-dependent receptor [Xanthocytophaga flavus]MDJ1472528.1 TonB-dependent receptor [Xanthocytophaga flavus]
MKKTYTHIRWLAASDRTRIVVSALGSLLLLTHSAEAKYATLTEKSSIHTSLIYSVLADHTITGSIKDKQTGDPLPGVSVVIKGTTQGTVSDKDGKFSLSVPDNAILIFSFIGYTALERNVGTENTLTIELTQDTHQLTEVRVVGYGTQTKAEFTGSAARVTGEAIKDVPVQSFDQALSGRAAGVSIAAPNGVLNNPPVIRVRGVNSISLSSYPLVVVDGTPINTGNVSSSTAVPNNPLGDINPADIESIDVLKDAASTSIYGSRAAAGVLLITTKRGKSGKPRISYEAWGGVSNVVRLPKLLNAEQYIAIKNEAVLNAKILGGNENNDKVASALFFENKNEDGSPIDTRWYDYIYRIGVSQNHNVSVSGGTKSTTYYFSANYTNQKGFLEANEFKRKSIRFNIDQEVNSWLKLKGSVSYNTSYNESPYAGSLPGSNFFLVGVARLAIALPPNVPAFNPDGSYNISKTNLNTIGMGNNQVVSNFGNPVALLELNRYTSENDRIIGSFGATAKLLKNLDFTTSYAIDRLRTENVSFDSPTQGNGYASKGAVSNVSAVRDNWNWTNTLTYAETFGGKHSLSVLAGYDVQKFTNSSWGATRTQVSDAFFDNYQGNWGAISASDNDLSERAYLSFFSRLTYDWNKRYFVTVNFRRDGNSALGSGKKYGNFGGVSAGWALSEEAFYKNTPFAAVLSNVKLRASWGRVGNGNLSNAFSALELYSGSLYGSAPTWALSQAGNQNLGWETSDQTNIGADLGFWNDRLQLELTYFNNNVNGLILSAPQAVSKGIPGGAILSNVGSMYNRGIEVGINATIIRKGDFTWNAALNYTNLRNEVTALADGNTDIVGTTHVSYETTNITRVGHSVGSLYGAKTAGVNPENGRRIFINKKGEKVQYSQVVAPGQSQWTYLDGTKASAITGADYYLIGNALPKWYGGLSNTFTYKNFDLSINFTFSGGNLIMNGTRATLLDQRAYNNSTEILKRWQKPGDITDIPRLVYNDQTSSGSSFPVSTNAEKADFLRLQNASIGYRLPDVLFTKTGISGIRVYAQGSNLFLLTPYKGTDPESSVNGNSNTTPGVEKNSVGQARSFTLGLNVSF